MRAVSGQDQTGELSWPLVDRRHMRSNPPTGIDRRQVVDGDDLDRLSTANQILLSLQKIAITLPSSFDLEKVLDQGVAQVQELIGADIVTVLLANDDETSLLIVRGRGSAQRLRIESDALPRHIAQALHYNHSVSSELSQTTRGFADEALLGSYCALRSRGFNVGLIAAEWRQRQDITQQTQALTGVADALGVAVDNARLFRDIRQQSASEERMRIARDLHDRTGSTLAFIGLELDRLIRKETAEEKQAELTEIRDHVSKTISEVREMLYNLRTGREGQNSLSDTVQEFVGRVSARAHVQVTCDFTAPVIDNAFVTNEIWEMIKEALLNAERHSQASELVISTSINDNDWIVAITDNGIGLRSADKRQDAYGMTGMLERAENLGAEISIMSPLSEKTYGTRVSITVPMEILGGPHLGELQ
jgi:signal transduction histidine kinase